MRKEYSAALRILFKQELTKLPLPWKPFSEAVGCSYPGERLFYADPPEVPARVWCSVVPHPRFDRFFVEIGWSKDHRFPDIQSRPSHFHPATASRKVTDCMIRLSDLVPSNSGDWIVEPFRMPTTVEEAKANLLEDMRPRSKQEAAERVTPVVLQAINDLQQFGYPFLLSAAPGEA